MTQSLKAATAKQTLRWYWHFTKDYKLLFWWGTIGAVLGVLTGQIFPPLIVAAAFDKIQALNIAGAEVTLTELQPYIIMFVISKLASVVIWRTEAYCTWKYDILAQEKIIEKIFNHLQSMGTKFHADRFGGALVSNANKFLGAYDRFVADFTWNIVTSVTAFVTSFIVFAFVSPAYALVFFFISSVYFTIIYKRMKKLAPLNRALSTSESDRTAKLADMITNISAVHSFAGEDAENNLFHKQANSTTKTHFKMMSEQMKNEVIGQTTTDLIDILAFTVGLIVLTTTNAPVGTLYIIVSYTFSLTNRLWQSMFIFRNLNRSFGDASDMTAIFAMTPEIQDDENAVQLNVARGDIRFKNVDFRYPDQHDDLLFSDLNLHIKPGEKVGLVGHSGGGKTTITKLLLRFMELSGGQIEIDGHDISKVTQKSLREHIAYVPQEPMLFHRSLADNITYGRQDASQAEIVAVAKMAHAHDFIEKLSDGYETLVGERGVKLSGGQRQRVAIARAMLKNAPILVLDEATSALDSESEQLIQDALWRLMEDRTAIVIAHRLSTIQKMDRILVMDNGQIAEQGSHRELIKQNGIYSQLWSRQSGGFLED